MLHLRALVVVVTTGAVVAMSTPANAAANNPVAVWEMNEARGAAVMMDSTSNGLHGDIGAEVVTGYQFDGATGYDFAWLRPNTPPAHPEHLVTVPDNDKLDPGARDYAVTIRMRTTSSFGNIVQKGQGGTPGGRFKFEGPKGLAKCTFNGSRGYVAVTSPRRINDGRWHVVRCDRLARSVVMTIDGVVVASKRGRTGTINNTWPLSIGGKSSCNQVKVTCDYFPGELDRVQIDAG